MIKFDLNTEKGQAYVRAMALIEEAVQLTDKHGRITAQVLTTHLTGRAIQQEVSKKKLLRMVGETYDWVASMKGLSSEQIQQRMFENLPNKH